jgi:hypothetical protein
VLGRIAIAAFTVSCAVTHEGVSSPALPSVPPSSLAEPRVPYDRARLLGSYVFPDEPRAVDACATPADEHDLVHCLLRRRFAEDDGALKLALRLYDETGIVPGVEARRIMNDDAYRGRVEIEPALPTGVDRQHLEWIVDAFDALGRLVRELQEQAPGVVRFVARPSALRFYRTANTTTPSAYVADGSIAYNLRGELFTSSESVFETLVHELFHLHDEVHGDWSERALNGMYQRVRRRCQGADTCLKRFAPHETRVNGGIYYAFHSTSDVREYAAELAIRYVREHRLRLAPVIGSPRAPRFKCLAAENAMAWRAISREFFGGLDLVPRC